MGRSGIGAADATAGSALYSGRGSPTLTKKRVAQRSLGNALAYALTRTFIYASTFAFPRPTCVRTAPMLAAITSAIAMASGTDSAW